MFLGEKKRFFGYIFLIMFCTQLASASNQQQFEYDWDNKTAAVWFLGTFTLCSLYLYALDALLHHIAPKYILKDLDRAAFPKAVEWIEAELRRSEVDPNAVTLKAVMPFSWATNTNCFGCYLFVPANDVQEIENMLNYHPDSPLLDRYRFVIAHEAAHMRHEHSKKRRPMALQKGFGASLIFSSYMAFIVPNLHTFFEPGLGHSDGGYCQCRMNQIWVGLAGLLLGFQCLIGQGNEFIRMQEQEADDTVCSDPAILEGGVKYFQEIRQFVGDDGQSESRYFDTHPRLAYRIEMLKKRLQTLVSAAFARLF